MSSKESNSKSFMDRLRERRNKEEKKPVSIPPLEVMVSELMSITDEVWGKYAFRREPLRGRFDENQKQQMIRKANECGKMYARKLKDQYPNLSMKEYAEKLGLIVDYPEKPNGGGHIIFAQFVEPNKITVFNDSVQKAETLIREQYLESLFCHTKVSEILLAHEIFHYIEEQNEKEIYTRTETICLWKIGPFKYKSKIVCLGEIAGMAFAREMLGLSFSPYVLDSFLVYSYNKEVSYYLYEEIIKLNKMK